MKLRYILLFSTLFIVACATTQLYDVPREYVAIRASSIADDEMIDFIEIPSHGAAGDSLAIGAGGGGNAKSVRETLVKLSNNGGGGVVITSRNPALSRAVIEGAIEGHISNLTNVTLVYAGVKEQSDKLEPIVKSSGMDYGFVDITLGN